MSINYSSSNTDNYLPNGSTGTSGATPPLAAADSSNPSSIRLAASGLANGASNAWNDIAGKVFNFDFKAANGTPLGLEVDWRLRVSMQPASASLFYNNPNNPIMYPLSATSGLVFPYTPSVTLTHAARYGSSALTHANYQSHFYEGSEVQSITISGEFTVQNIAEGQYLMAAIQYMRACTKMFFGGSALAGTPPPMVFLDGYGPAYLPHVPCVVTSFSHTMPSDVDYVDIPVGVSLQNIAGNQITPNNFAARTRLPTMSTLSITLQPVYSRNNIAKNFTLEAFNAGALVRSSTDTSGGFL